jgi:hypothetical protein
VTSNDKPRLTAEDFVMLFRQLRRTGFLLVYCEPTSTKEGAAEHLADLLVEEGVLAGTQQNKFLSTLVEMAWESEPPIGSPLCGESRRTVVHASGDQLAARHS